MRYNRVHRVDTTNNKYTEICPRASSMFKYVFIPRMRYLTHLVLFHQDKASREQRDSFGTDSASCCWCQLMLSPPSTTPASHVKPTTTTTQDIELHSLTPSGRSRVTESDQVASEGSAQTCQTQIPLPLRPPMAHCRPQNRNSSNNRSSRSSSLNNPPHSSLYQISPLSR